jgi:hypothetical protein
MGAQPAFAVSTFVSPKEHLLVQKMRSEISAIKGSTSRVLYGCHLSALLSPNDRCVETDAERDAAYRSILVATVVRRVSNSPPVFTVIDQSDPYAEVTLRLLARARIDCLSVDIDGLGPETCDEVCRRTRKALKAGVLATSRVTNKSERTANKLTDTAIGLTPLPRKISNDGFLFLDTVAVEKERRNVSMRMRHLGL